MLGRRDPQQSLFSAQNLPHRVPVDSFYGRMGAVSSVLFCDDDLKGMYDPANGRPSIPPSLMSGVLLLRKGMRKLLKQLGYAAPGKQRGLAPETQRLVASYLEQDRKAKIDWADPAQRLAQLAVLVQDAAALLDLASEHSDDAEVRATAWLLGKIMGDDLEQDDQGHWQIAQGTAPDRIISMTDPEMRHGRQSSAQRFDGFKVAVTTGQTSELILDIADVPASGGDGQSLMPTVERVEQYAGVTVQRVIGDAAYGSGENRAACTTHAGHAVDLVAPLALPTDPVVDKSAFRLDLAAQTATVTAQASSPKRGPLKEGAFSALA